MKWPQGDLQTPGGPNPVGGLWCLEWPSRCSQNRASALGLGTDVALFLFSLAPDVQQEISSR